MFSAGDRVLYPMYGAGIIEGIEEKEIFGKTKSYYVMKMPIGDMKVMIPTDSCESVGLRLVITEDVAYKTIEGLSVCDDDEMLNWNKRHRENIAKLKSGDIDSIAEVVKGLVRRENDKGLSMGERQLLFSARQIFVSELVLSLETTRDEVEKLIDQSIATVNI